MLPKLIFEVKFVLPGSLTVGLASELGLFALSAYLLVEVDLLKRLGSSGVYHLLNGVTTESLNVFVVASTNGLATLVTIAVALHLQFHCVGRYVYLVEGSSLEDFGGFNYTIRL